MHWGCTLLNIDRGVPEAPKAVLLQHHAVFHSEMVSAGHLLDIICNCRFGGRWGGAGLSQEGLRCARCSHYSWVQSMVLTATYSKLHSVHRTAGGIVVEVLIGPASIFTALDCDCIGRSSSC